MKELPHSYELEKNLISSLILKNDKELIDSLTEDDFFDNRNKIIFKHIKKLPNVDILLLITSLRESKELFSAGGEAYLLELPDTAIFVNKSEQLKKIKELSNKRKLIESLEGKLNECYGQIPYEDIINGLQRLTESVEIESEGGFANFKKLLGDVVNEVNNKEQGLIGLSTGLKDLDEITLGLQKGDYILISARPSMGKTALALSIAQNCAFVQKKKVALFSLEMPSKQLMYRIIAGESKVNLKGLKSGILKSEEWDRLFKSVGDLMQWYEQYLFIEDNSMLTISEMKNECKKLKKEQGLDLVVIDYLQLINTKGKNESRQQEVSKISRELKSMAKELDVPLIVLSQLSRSPEARVNKRPMLSDLRESGSIEQDADLVMMLYRDEYYNKNTEDDFTEIIIAKHRNGEVGTIYVDFDKSRCNFSDRK